MSEINYEGHVRAWEGTVHVQRFGDRFTKPYQVRVYAGEDRTPKVFYRNQDELGNDYWTRVPVINPVGEADILWTAAVGAALWGLLPR